MDIECAVHWAIFHVTDADGGPLPGVQLVALDEATLGVVGFSTTDGAGGTAMRLPDTTYRVEVYWRNTMVLRTDGIVLDGQDIDETLACQVFQATIRVVDGSGAQLPDVPVVLEDTTGAVVATAITDGEGTVVFQLGEDAYEATARLQTTYRWTEIDMEETVTLDVNASGTYEVRFGAYPPSVIGTVQFWAIFSIVLIFLLMMYVVLLWRRSLSETPEDDGPEDAEEEAPGEDAEAEAKAEDNPTGIKVETPIPPPRDED